MLTSGKHLLKSKLRSYSKFQKKTFTFENYIKQFPLSMRRILTKFRISAHNLAIETGRYTKPIKIPIENRKCFHCSQVEDQFHVIFECNLYSEERLDFFETLQNVLHCHCYLRNKIFVFSCHV